MIKESRVITEFNLALEDFYSNYHKNKFITETFFAKSVQPANVSAPFSKLWRFLSFFPLITSEKVTAQR